MIVPKTLSLDRPNPRRAIVGQSGPEAPACILDVFIYGPENEALTDLFSSERLHQLGAVSPIYLYGPHSVGKTVLANSMAARFSRIHQPANPVICLGSDFARSLQTAIEADDMERFRARFRQSSLLVIDGLQDLLKKAAAQDELVQTLDRREAHRMPTIITGLVLPTAMRGLRPALASRCIGGLSLAIQFPGPEARRRILTLLAKSLDIRLTSNELTHFSSRLTEPISVPELQGLLFKWLHQERVEHTLATSSNSAALDRIIDARQSEKTPDIAEIAKRAAKETNVKLSDLRGTTRKSQVVRARSLAMYVARQVTPLSYQQIGEYFGRRDHTTVMHACRKIEAEILSDPPLQRMIEEVKRQLLRA